MTGAVTGRRLLAALLLLAAGCSGSQGASSASPSVEVLAPTAPDAAPVLGVVTHFDQGWSPALVRRVRDIHAAVVRDVLPWAASEPAPGRYDFDGRGAAPLRALCRGGTGVLLLIAPQQPGYDGGQAVHTPAGIAAFAAFAGVVAQRFGACLTGIQIGNEINDPRNLPYPAGVAVPAAYVATLRAVKAELVRRGTRVPLVAGSTNAIGTGFLDTLFAAGLLDVADVVSVHPYRSQAENVDLELDHLRAVMRRRGRVLPIWATELGDYYRTPELAADELVKLVTLLGVSGTAQIYWYLLIDEPWFRNMGLYDRNDRAKPAAAAFRTMATVMGRQRPVRIDLGDGGIRLYRLGTDSFVLWGAGGAVAFDGKATAIDARGDPVHLDPDGSRADGSRSVVAVREAPLVVTGAGAPHLLRSSGVVADSLFGYARAPWSYLARAHGQDAPLPYTDWTWTSDFFSPYLNPVRISDPTLVAAGAGPDPVRSIVRYTAPSAQRLSLAACFHQESKGGGVDLALVAGGRTLWREALAADAGPAGIDLDLAAGETLDLQVTPLGQPSVITYRLRLFARGAARPTPCLHRSGAEG